MTNESVNNNIEHNKQMKKIKKELLKRLKEYEKTMNFMACDAPIEILCLDKPIQKALIDHGFLRVYDLINRDFIEVEGLNESRIRNLTTCLDKFFAML